MRGRGHRGVVQRVGEPDRAVRVAVAHVGPPRLPVEQRRAAVRLAVRAQRRHPGVDVVHPVLARAHVTGGALDHLVGQAEPLQQLLGGAEQLGVPAVGLGDVGRADDELLDLLELVHPQQPAHVPAGAARLPAEARRDAGVPDRQLLVRPGSRRCGSRPGPPPRCPPGTGRRRGSRRSPRGAPGTGRCRSAPPPGPATGR